MVKNAHTCSDYFNEKNKAKNNETRLHSGVDTTQLLTSEGMINFEKGDECFVGILLNLRDLAHFCHKF